MEDLNIREDLVIPGSELKMMTSRSSGPGGQHVNKTSTRVTLKWDVYGSCVLDEESRSLVLQRLSSRITREGFLLVHAEDEKSQMRNKERARSRMAALLRQALARRKTRVPTRLGSAVKARRLDSKRRLSRVKRLRRKPGPEE